MCNNTKIDKTGRKIGKKSKEIYILNVNDILNDFLTFFLLLNMSFYIFPNPPLPVYQIFTRRGNNQDKYNPGITDFIFLQKLRKIEKKCKKQL